MLSNNMLPPGEKKFSIIHTPQKGDLLPLEKKDALSPQKQRT